MKKIKRAQTKSEEIANVITHGVAALLILIANPIIIVKTEQAAGIIGLISVTVYTIAVFLMFLTSALYHLMAPASKHKEIFHILDHIMIFVAIAGTYTPIALVVIGGWQGWLIFAIQWGAVLWGVLFKALFDKKSPRATILIYLIMGWVAVLFIYSFVTSAHLGLVLLILLGGVFYSLGSYFYQKNARYGHMIWHLMVLAGAVAHFLALTLFLVK